MANTIQFAGSIVRSGAGELDLIAEFNNREPVTNFIDQMVTIAADTSQEVCGMSGGVNFVALMVEEGSVELVLITDSVETAIPTSKLVVLTGINVDEVQVRNTSEDDSAKVRIVAGG